MNARDPFELAQEEQKQLESTALSVRPEDAAKPRTKFGKKLEHLEGRIRGSRYFPDLLASLISDARHIYAMLCDENYTVEWKTKAWIVFALTYFISPLDMLPDAIPVVGYLDDAGVVAWVCHHLSLEIKRYKAFLKATPPSSDS